MGAFIRGASSGARPLILVIQFGELNQYTQATRSAFAYQRPAFAYVIIFTFDRLSQSQACARIVTKPKSDFGYAYIPMRGGQARSYLIPARYT
uniref:Uncharacterized protein n=1 Tax=Hyaloperonospora arabidopsidis (strain Emoy2) TaxID=559515 RepID=M4BZE1_HYAAE